MRRPKAPTSTPPSCRMESARNERRGDRLGLVPKPDGVAPLLPPPNRNRLLPISIALLGGRNPRIRGFGWGRVGVGGREMWQSMCLTPRPPPPTPPHKGEGRRKSRTTFDHIGAARM